MKKTLWFVTSILLVAQISQANTVRIVVSDSKDKNCLKPPEVEVTQDLLDSKEIKSALKIYFQEQLNPELHDAAIVNAQIRFCSDEERKETFSFIVKNLDTKKPSKRVFQVIKNYYRSSLMKKALNDSLSSKDTSADFRANIFKAKRIAERAWSKN